MVIAPLDANTLGKIANGLCDNLLVKKRDAEIFILNKNDVDLCTSSLECNKASGCLPCNEHQYVDTPFYYKAFGCANNHTKISNHTTYK